MPTSSYSRVFWWWTEISFQLGAELAVTVQVLNVARIITHTLPRRSIQPQHFPFLTSGSQSLVIQIELEYFPWSVGSAVVEFCLGQVEIHPTASATASVF